MEDGATIAKTYTPHNFHGWTQRYERVAQLLDSPRLRRGPVLGAEAFLLEASELWKAAPGHPQRESAVLC